MLFFSRKPYKPFYKLSYGCHYGVSKNRYRGYSFWEIWYQHCVKHGKDFVMSGEFDFGRDFPDHAGDVRCCPDCFQERIDTWMAYDAQRREKRLDRRRKRLARRLLKSGKKPEIDIEFTG